MLILEWSQGCYGRTDGWQCYYIPSQLRWRGDNKCKTKSNWEKYRQQRNLVTKIKKKSIKTYFFERCIGGPKSKDCWPTIKPFITNKGSHFTKNIILCEKDEIINDQNMIAECFNDFFINVAKDIGNVTNNKNDK